MRAQPKPEKRGRKPKKPLPRPKRALGWRRRAAKAESTATPDARELILVAFSRRCAYCRTRMASEWDHRIPITRGGKDEPANLVPACYVCNREKGTQTWALPLGHPFAVYPAGPDK